MPWPPSLTLSPRGGEKLKPLGLVLGLRKATGEREGRKNFPLTAPIPFPFDKTKVPSFFLQFNMAVLNNRKHGAPNENACKASYLSGGDASSKQ